MIASASEAIHIAAKKEWIASSRSLLAMTLTRFRLLAARCARGLHLVSLENRGRRECRVLDAPVASRVEKNTRVSHHGHAGSPGIPRAMVLTVSFVLSPVTGLCCHRRQWSCLHQLDASVGASGPHDFAVRVSAVRPRKIFALRAFASIASPPYVRDDRETPLCVGRDGDRCRSDLGLKNTRIFLRDGLDRRLRDLPVRHNQSAPVVNFESGSSTCAVPPLTGTA